MQDLRGKSGRLEELKIDQSSVNALRCCELTIISQLLYIQHCDFDPPLSEQLYYNLSDSITATCHHHNLFVPVVSVIAPAIGNGCIEPCAGFGDSTDRKECLEMFEGGIVGGSKEFAP